MRAQIQTPACRSEAKSTVKNEKRPDGPMTPFGLVLRKESYQGSLSASPGIVFIRSL